MVKIQYPIAPQLISGSWIMIFDSERTKVGNQYAQDYLKRWNFIHVLNCGQKSLNIGSQKFITNEVKEKFNSKRISWISFYEYENKPTTLQFLHNRNIKYNGNERLWFVVSDTPQIVSELVFE